MTRDELSTWELVHKACSLPATVVPLAATLVATSRVTWLDDERRAHLLRLLSRLGDVSPTPLTEAVADAMRHADVGDGEGQTQAARAMVVALRQQHALELAIEFVRAEAESFDA
jgi:hypothetical protein